MQIKRQNLQKKILSNCLILQFLTIQTVLFCKFFSSKLHKKYLTYANICRFSTFHSITLSHKNESSLQSENIITH